jgi:hypothetical protein
MAVKYLFILSCLAGCSDKTPIESSMEKYAARMANVLEIESINIKYPNLSTNSDRLPRKADMTSVTSDPISLITLSKLNQCGLGSIIAERNTTLGKTQLPSSRLIWESKFLQQLNYCSKQSLEESISLTITDILLSKNTSWESQWSFFVQQSDAIRQSLQQNVKLIQGQNDGIASTVAALNYIHKLNTFHINNEHSISTSELESHLQNLQIHKLPAAVWRTQRYVEDNLRQLTHWLENNINLETCSSDKQFQQKAIYLRNVFELFFVTEIQPIASALNNYLYQINPIVNTLVKHQAINQQFSNWVSKRADDSSYKQSFQTHIDFWQRFFKACEFSVN